VAAVSAAIELLRAAKPEALARAAPSAPPVALARADAVAIASRVAHRLGDEWLPRAAWTVARTGRGGLLGVALLLGAGVFLLSTHLPVASEVATMRSDLEAARRPAARRADRAGEPPVAVRQVPARDEMPAILRELFAQAGRARLTVDTGRYEVRTMPSGGLVRHQIAFPVAGPYPQIRAFIDATLASMPEVALADLTLERKAIGDAKVDAQLRLNVFTGEGGDRGATLPSTGGLAERVVPPIAAASLFAPHSWYVAPPPRPPPPPAPEPPPPEPTAPPFPYTLVGRFAPGNDPPVYFLSRGDRVLQVHVGDRFDGVYQLESAGPYQLTFVYLPLNVRQSLDAGGAK
jgi:hypothetical protein